jgi:hypothetical protein
VTLLQRACARLAAGYGDNVCRQLGNAGVMGKDLDGHMHRFMKLSIEYWLGT